MANIEVSIVIDRPLDEVFAYLADEENNVNWRSGMVDVRRTSEGPVGVGTTYRIVNHVMGRRIEGEAEVTQFELNRKYATTNKSGPRIETRADVRDRRRRDEGDIRRQRRPSRALSTGGAADRKHG